MIPSPLLSVDHLSVTFATDQGQLAVVDQVSFELHSGRTLALVGESGCGKSVTASCLMGLLPQPSGTISGGRIVFEGKELTELSLSERYKVRGGGMAMVFQEPATALNPVQTVGAQIREVLLLHRPDLRPSERDDEVVRLLKQVEMPAAESRLKNYPFQLSGGMRQRVMIAMALAGRPRLLIADEPTTALDVTVQAQILDLIRNLQKQTGMAVLYITHDMGVVAEMADDVVVMYAGQVVETGSVRQIFASPQHPYTRGLLGCMPRLDSVPKSRLATIPGAVPSPRLYSQACRFAERCRWAEPACRASGPEVTGSVETGTVRCFRAGRLT